ncbi:hypothetical protein [Castellaniella sp.]|uniref:hypothetical protein n=1 Tax=Castellaniella sp. TaxID=1955812 RepID=UPI002AFF1DBE|nr:hypothetical protein [Castellaniella sp.]
MSNITVFSPNLVGTGCDGVRGSYARIGWHTITRDTTLSVSSERAGFPGIALKNATTYDRWSPVTLPAWAQWDAGGNVDVDYVGIASHNLGGATVSVQHSQDGTAWTDAIVLTPSKNDALIAWWEQVTARYWRVLIDGNDIYRVGVIYLGKILVMPRSITSGHSPAMLSRNTDILPAKSDTGQFLGRSIIRQGFATTYQWESLPAQWYRDSFDPFVAAAVKYPFFLVANPARWPGESMYAWATKDVKPRYQRQRDWMEVSVPVEAIG